MVRRGKIIFIFSCVIMTQSEIKRELTLSPNSLALFNRLALDVPSAVNIRRGIYLVKAYRYPDPLEVDGQ